MRKKTLEIRNITLAITNRCNLYCKMCTIWKEKKKRDLEISQIKKLILSPIFKKPIQSISLTGGEPFLYPKINTLYKFLTLAKEKKLIKSIGIYTNGYNTKQILRFLKENKSFLYGLDLGISLDGSQKIHNFLRGKKDAWQKTINTIKKIHTYYPQVNLEIKFTITPYNFKEISKIYRFCRKNNLFFSPKFVESGTKNYYHKAGKPLLETNFSSNQKKEIQKSLISLLKKEKTEKKKIIDAKVIGTLYKFLSIGKKLIKSCKTPYYCLFINPEGKIYPCVYFPPIADLSKNNWEEELLGEKYKSLAKKALKGKCQKCLSYHGFLKDFNLSKNL